MPRRSLLASGTNLDDLNKNQTHSSKEANKEDEMVQELSLFDELTE